MKKEKVKILSNEVGMCPYCNSQNIDYDSARFHTDGMVSWRAICNGCHREFEEWHEMNFVGHNVGTNLDIDANDVLDKEIEYESC